MRLLIDIGNTRLKWALLINGKLAPQHTLVHHQDGMAAQLDQHWTMLTAPKKIHMVSVASQAITQAVIDWVSSKWGCTVDVLQPVKQAGGVFNGYAQPECLGVDRWAAMIGAYALVGSAACVIDCGTALTCDAVDSHGNHLGGVIAPGQAMMRNALLQNTAGIEITDESALTSGWGTDTSGCVLAGTMQSAIGLMERMISLLQTQLNEPVMAVLTGGDAEALLPLLTFPYRYEADLVLQGIAHIVTEQRA